MTSPHSFTHTPHTPRVAKDALGVGRILCERETQHNNRRTGNVDSP